MPLSPIERLIVKPSDLRIVLRPVVEHADHFESKIIRDLDGEVIGIRPAENSLNPETLIAAIRLLTERLETITPHMAGRRLDDLAWVAADHLTGLVNDYLLDASPTQLADLVAANERLRHELGRLWVMAVRDPETGRMQAAQVARNER